MDERVEPKEIKSAIEEVKTIPEDYSVMEVSGEEFLGSWVSMVSDYQETLVNMSTEKSGY